ncbi:putative uncharacterized protein DDB_G0286901 isoform X2 [Galleria mellonella]|nr:putative uncharacterized protein DDB_G0286901 isoform X2 [Galleria mellonella]
MLSYSGSQPISASALQNFNRNYENFNSLSNANNIGLPTHNRLPLASMNAANIPITNQLRNMPIANNIASANSNIFLNNLSGNNNLPARNLISNNLANSNLLNGNTVHTFANNMNVANSNLANQYLYNTNLANLNSVNQNLAHTKLQNNFYDYNSNICNSVSNPNSINMNVASVNLANGYNINTGKFEPINNQLLAEALSAYNSGIEIIADGLEVGGSLSIRGQYPIQGTVGLNGNLPSNGMATTL